MTMEEYIKKHCGPNCYGEQDENGVDLSLIRENLKLTPEQRSIRADNGRHSALELRRYGEQTRQHRALAQK